MTEHEVILSLVVLQKLMKKCIEDNTASGDLEVFLSFFFFSVY